VKQVDKLGFFAGGGDTALTFAVAVASERGGW
jgi:hypothetical protein